MKDILKIWIKDKILLTVWITTILLIGIFTVVIQKDNVFGQFIGVNNIVTQQIIIFSAICNFALIISLFRVVQKYIYRIPERGLKFSNENGCWSNIDETQYFCPKCMKERRAPLQYKDPSYFLKCNVCGGRFTGPNYERKSRSCISSLDR